MHMETVVCRQLLVIDILLLSHNFTEDGLIIKASGSKPDRTQFSLILASIVLIEFDPIAWKNLLGAIAQCQTALQNRLRLSFVYHCYE